MSLGELMPALALASLAIGALARLVGRRSRRAATIAAATFGVPVVVATGVVVSYVLLEPSLVLVSIFYGSLWTAALWLVVAAAAALDRRLR